MATATTTPMMTAVSTLPEPGVELEKERVLQVLSTVNTKRNTTDNCTQSAMNLVW